VAVLKLKKWGSAQYLKTQEDMALYLDACLQEAGDDAALARWGLELGNS
jgi:DNA-binding phage protein